MSMVKKKVKLPLSKTHPEIAKEADGWDPSQVVAGSEKKLGWMCSFGHKYIAMPGTRTKENGSKCPVCANQKLLVGFNDLATTHPEIAKEADGWDPSQVVAGSNRKVQWKCKLDHKWVIGVTNRTGPKKSGCPYCSNQKRMIGFNDLATTHPEIAKEADGWDPSQVVAGTSQKLQWKCINGHIWIAGVGTRTDEKRRRGCPVCANRRVLKGVNDLATTHPKLAEEAYGWDPSTVIAGSNKKLKWKCKNGHVFEALPNTRSGRGSGCGYCSNHLLLKGFNDLKTRFPNIAKEADGWDPSRVMAGNSVKRNWICQQGHKFKATPDSRTQRKTGCPVCANIKVLSGFNDLATTHPEIAKEADGWDPKRIIAGTNKRLKWKCTEGHRYTTSGNHRIGEKATGCPTCANSGFDPNENGYLYFLVHNNWEMFQIGITNKPTDRIRSHNLKGWITLEIRGPMDGHLTQRWEASILKMLKSNGADLSNQNIAGKFDGYTEAWSKSTFPVKSIKELMQLTEQFEEMENR